MSSLTIAAVTVHFNTIMQIQLRFSFLPNKSRNTLPDPVNPFLSHPKITMADVKNIWAMPPAAGDHAHVGDDIRDLDGTNVSLSVKPRLFYTDVSEFSRCGGVNRPPQGQKIKNSAKFISHHEKKRRERIILRVLSSSLGRPHTLKSTMEMSFYSFHAFSLEIRLDHMESNIKRQTT